MVDFLQAVFRIASLIFNTIFKNSNAINLVSFFLQYPNNLIRYKTKPILLTYFTMFKKY
jgi:hypothetical protein